MATDERKRMLAEQTDNSTKVLPKILNLKDLNLKILRSQYTDEQQRVVRAAVGSVALTRKTGRISDSVKNKILDALSKFSPEIVSDACQIYVTKCCATDGKNERYLIGIARGLSKQQEAQKRMEPPKIDPDNQWFDGLRVWDREDMENQQYDIATIDDRARLDPPKVSRVNRCMNDRPKWEWK